MAAFFLAYLSKESSITLLPVFPLSLYITTDSSLSRILKGSWFVLIPTVLFLLIRHQVLYSNAFYEAAPPAVADNMLMVAKEPFLQLTSAVGMMGYYLASVFFPVNLTFDMSYPQVAPMEASDWRVLLTGVVLLESVAVAFVGLKKRLPESLALLFFFCTVSVSSNIFMLIGTHYGERLMYLPSFGLVLLLALVLQRIPSMSSLKASELKPLLLAVVMPVCVVFAVLTMMRNPVWANNGTLYASGLNSAPNSVRVQYYQGLYLGKPETIESYPAASRDSVLQAAYGHLTRATELYPFFTDSWTQLGVISHRDKKPDLALKYYAKARECNPNDPVIINNASTVLFEQQKYQEAMQGFMDAVRLKPDYADALMNIGSCYGLTGNYREALTWFDKAIAVDPGLAQAYFFSAVTWERLGNPTRAAELFRKAEELKAAAPRKN
jgi:tetratricopeptide (TPR) repeat protein